MSDTPSPTQAALGRIRTGVIRNAIAENVQPDANGVIAPFSFQPPGGVSGWQRVRISNYTPYLFQVIGIPGGGSGDPPQMLQPFQSHVWNYEASRGMITLQPAEPGSPLAVPPLRFAYSAGTATGDLLFNYVTVEWTDTPDLFFGYYPVPLTGITITAEAIRTGLPTLIPVGDTPVALALNVNTNRLYVANSAGHSVSVIDTASNAVIATLPLAAAPTALAVNRFTNRLYVALSGAGNSVAIFDTAANVLLGMVNVGAAQTGITFDEVGNKKYVSLAAGNAVAVLSATDVHTGNVAVGVGPQGIASDPVTGQIYVACKTAGTVYQINDGTDTVVGIPIVVGTLPVAVSVDGNLQRVYVANETDDTVSVINSATALVIATTGVGNSPVALSSDFVNGRTFVADNLSNTVDVIDGITNLVIDTLNPGVGPTAVLHDTANNKTYVAITANAVIVL